MPLMNGCRYTGTSSVKVAKNARLHDIHHPDLNEMNCIRACADDKDRLEVKRDAAAAWIQLSISTGWTLDNNTRNNLIYLTR